MAVLEDLRESIDAQRERLRLDVPADREAAILAVVRALDEAPVAAVTEWDPDPVTGRRIENLGGNLALHLCLAADHEAVETASPEGMDDWAGRFLVACHDLAAAGQVLDHGASGLMRIVSDGPGSFAAWLATRRAPASWRERFDVDWWARSPQGRGLRDLEPGVDAPGAVTAGALPPGAPYRERATELLQHMAWQLPYPADAGLGGIAIRMWCGVLRELLALALEQADRGQVPAPVSARTLAESIAPRLGTDSATVADAMAGFTLDSRTSAWHALTPGVATAPVVRIDTDRIVLSRFGLATEPLLFLTRELRRRDSAGYHSASALREVAFRNDLYSLFEDNRFVTSVGRIELRGSDRAPRTDIDAAIFDRKTGTLALFELKSQDPFARSPGALARQRDNLLQANRQVSSVLDWLNRNGANEVLNRVDRHTAKRFRVRRVLPFVLGRFLVQFDNGPEMNRRAAWGTWPQVLRLRDDQQDRGTGSNPLLSLHTRLRKGDLEIDVPDDMVAREITLGPARLTVYPSYAAFRAVTGDNDVPGDADDLKAPGDAPSSGRVHRPHGT